MLPDRETLLAIAVVGFPLFIIFLAVWIIVDQKRNPTKYEHIKGRSMQNSREHRSDFVLRRGRYGSRGK